MLYCGSGSDLPAVLVLVVMKFRHKPPDRYCCKKNKMKMEQAKLARKLQHFRQGAVFCTPCCDRSDV